MRLILVALSLAALQLYPGAIASAEDSQEGDRIYLYSRVSMAVDEARPALEPWLSISTEQGRLSWGGHVLDYLAPCGQDGKFHCFSTTRLSFAVPTDGVKPMDHWAVDGRKYVAVGWQSFELLGVSAEVMLIKGDEEFADTRGRRYLWSPESGLLAIQRVTGDGRVDSLLISAKAYGFPK